MLLADFLDVNPRTIEKSLLDLLFCNSVYGELCKHPIRNVKLVAL
jgi:hypothetical protein